MIHTEELDFILSPAGRAVLNEVAASPLTPDLRLATVGHLRERLGTDKAGAVLEMALLRQRATRKFSRAGRMFFTRDGLEQATAEAVATHRATRYTAAGMGRVADMGCGIGGDALALAGAGCEVIAIDRDYVHVALARENAAVYDAGDYVWPVLGDLTELLPLPVDAFFFDPARRTPTGPRLAAARRLRSVDEYRPPLSLIDTWRPRVPNGAVKVSPGIDYSELPSDAEVEFVSLGGEVKEAMLWFGALRSDAGRRATVLPAGATLTDRDEGKVEIGPVRACLYEPDGAVIRAHLVGQLAGQIGATLIDPEIAYLSTDTPVPTPFATGYRIEDHFPFQLKRLRHMLRERGVGTVTIKKRGSPLDPDILRQSLRLRGKEHCFVFLTQVAGRHTALVAQALT